MAPYVGAPEIKARRLVLAVEYHGQIGNPGLVSRLYRGQPGRPRDLDLVVSGIPFEDIESRFNGLVARRNRFGGLQLKRDGWQFDVWPVGSTWALRKDGLGDAGFSALPSTTPFNLEAIAVDAWPYAARSRELFSGDDQFFEGVLSRTLEINRTDNPFPALTVVRALVLSAELGFRIGPKLVEYIASEGLALGTDELEQLQQQHYGHTRIGGRTLRALAISIGQQSGRAGSIDAPVIGQLPLWREEEAVSRLQVYYVGSQFRSPADRRIGSIAPRTEKVIGQQRS